MTMRSGALDRASMPILGKTKKHVVSEFRFSEIIGAASTVFSRKGFNDSYSERNRDFMRTYYTEFSNMLIHPAPVRQEFQDLYKRQAEELERVLLDGIQRNQVRKLNVLASARISYDMTRSLIAQRLLGWSQGSAEDDAGFLFDVIWKGVGCQNR